MNANVDVVQGEGKLDVKVCILAVLVRIDLAMLVCKLIAKMVKEQAEMLSLPD
jgi:hypothetical protein